MLIAVLCCLRLCILYADNLLTMIAGSVARSFLFNTQYVLLNCYKTLILTVRLVVTQHMTMLGW